MRKWIVAILAVACLGQSAVHAWGPTAHRVIARAAVRALPPDVPGFLAREIDWIGERSVAPDSWRASSEPFIKMEEDPNHEWYMEQFAFLHPIPRSRTAFILAIYDEHRRLEATDPAAAAMMNVRWTGTLPYQAVEIEERLKVAFREWRAQRAAGQDTAFIERDAAFYVGWLAHYVGDAAMPLHTSVQHDGWQGDNPRGYTRDGSIHWRFENDFVNLIGLGENQLLPRMAPARRLPDPFSDILAFLDRSHTRVEAVYQLDQQGAFRDAASKPGRDLVLTCTAEAAAMLRDFVATAWWASAEPGAPIPPPPGAIPPNDPRDPNYDPATGSAPAPAPAGAAAR